MGIHLFDIDADEEKAFCEDETFANDRTGVVSFEDHANEAQRLLFSWAEFLDEVPAIERRRDGTRRNHRSPSWVPGMEPKRSVNVVERGPEE